MLVEVDLTRRESLLKSYFDIINFVDLANIYILPFINIKTNQIL